MPQNDLLTLRRQFQGARRKASELAQSEYALPDVLREAVRQRDRFLPMIQQTRRGLSEEQNTVAPRLRSELVGQVSNPFAIEEAVATQEGRLGSRLQEVGDIEEQRGFTLRDLVDRGTRLFGQRVQAARDIESGFREDLTRAESAAEAERQRQFEAQQRAMDRASKGSGSGLSIGDLVALSKNPLVKMELAGYRREPAPDGGKGFWFYDQQGNPVKVDDVASAIGASPNSLLEGSNNPYDQRLIQEASGKGPSSGETGAQAGLRQVERLRGLLPQLNRVELYAAQPGGPGLSGLVDRQIRGGLRQGLQYFGNDAAQQFQTAANEAKDILQRLRTGAAINDQELAFYTQFIPQAGDSSQVRNQKLGNLQFVFESIAQGRKPTPAELEDETVTDTGV